MCDSAKCDDCNKFSRILLPIKNNWYVCPRCKEKRENADNQ